MKNTKVEMSELNRVIQRLRSEIDSVKKQVLFFLLQLLSYMEWVGVSRLLEDVFLILRLTVHMKVVLLSLVLW